MSEEWVRFFFAAYTNSKDMMLTLPGGIEVPIESLR
jgi:hypothetical protein